MEILISGLVFVCAIWIIIKSVKKSYEGKCSNNCLGCSRKNGCNNK